MTDQPTPTGGKTSVTEPFRARFVHEGAERDMLGLERYGTALRTHNGRDAGRDAWEEWYDLGKYLEQLRIEHADALAEVERLTAQRDAAANANARFRERAERAEEQRDGALMKLATAGEEASAFRQQRDAALVSLADAREVMERHAGAHDFVQELATYLAIAGPERGAQILAAAEAMATPTLGEKLAACRICRSTWPIGKPERHSQVAYGEPCPIIAWRALVPRVEAQVQPTEPAP